MSKDLPLTYAICNICGDVPSGKWPRMNVGPIRYWDPDDGWIVAALCSYCFRDYHDRQPDPEDCAFSTTNDVCDRYITDEDFQF